MNIILDLSHKVINNYTIIRNNEQLFYLITNNVDKKINDLVITYNEDDNSCYDIMKDIINNYPYTLNNINNIKIYISKENNNAQCKKLYALLYEVQNKYSFNLNNTVYIIKNNTVRNTQFTWQ